MTYLNEARDLLTNGRLEASILVLKDNVQDPDLLNEVLALKSRYNVLESKINRGIIDDEDATLEHNRITNGVLVLISDLANPENRRRRTTGAPNTGDGGSRFDPKTILIGLLSLIILVGGAYFLSQSGKDTPPSENASLTEATMPPVTDESTLPGSSSENSQPAPAERNTSNPPVRPPSTTPRTESSPETAQPPTSTPPENTSPPPPAPEEPTTPADPCAQISCLNGGQCVSGRCDCPPGYSGDRCQTRVRLSGEDCLSFNANRLRILEESGRFILSDGSSRMITFPNREEAQKTIDLIRHYKLKGNCFAQRPKPNLTYFLTAGYELPQGSFPQEDCIRIRDAQNLKARSYNENSWILADGSHVIFRTKSKSETEMIQRVMRHYDPGYICYVGRPDPSVVYLRK